jgi:predicted ATP-grasp superfamily ATP-dependent carboligase
LGLIDYYGIAEVEFMRDPRDHMYKLIEVNPRVWGWHTLGIACGLDFPYLVYLDMIGEQIEVPSSLNRVKWIRLFTDIPTAFSEMVKGNLRLGDYLASLKGKKTEPVLSLADPLPFLTEILLYPYRRMKRGI